MKPFEWGENYRLRKAFKWMDHKYNFTSLDALEASEEKDVESSECPFEVTAFLSRVGFLVERNLSTSTLLLTDWGICGSAPAKN